MNKTQALTILRALQEEGQRWLSPDVLAALAVVTEDSEIAPPAPSTAPLMAPTGRVTGFVGVFYCPGGLWLSDDRSRWIPVEPREPAVAWNRLLSFGVPRMVRPQRSDETWLQSFIDVVLPSRWRVDPIEDDDIIQITLSEGISLRVPAREEMVRAITLGSRRQWDFKRGASLYDFMTLLAQAAIARGIAPDREGQFDGGEVVNMSVDAQRAAFSPAPVRVRSVEAYLDWANQLARAYYQTTGREVWQSTAFDSFSELEQSEQEAWTFWMRNHPGMLRLELALRGFFANGGEEAWIALSVERESLPHQQRGWVKAAFEGADLDQIAAPGLGHTWQAAIGDDARRRGIFAVQEPPRYAHCAPPVGQAVDPKTRWMGEKSGYEGHLTAMPAPIADVRPWLIVNNPLSMGSHDAVRLSPPAGHLAAGQAPRA
ncbi:MAG: hypothetical protein AAFV53_12525 [Myxococcota bacterium]